MKKQLYRVTNHVLRKSQKLLGIVTLGVRAAVFDGQNRICLVKHTYTRGWHLPGGGIDRGETALHAIIRELQEEVGVIVTSQPKLFAVYHHRIREVHDYPILYIINDFTIDTSDDPEIDEIQWCDPNDLPIDTTPATKRRIQELLGLREVAEHW